MADRYHASAINLSINDQSNLSRSSKRERYWMREDCGRRSGWLDRSCESLAIIVAALLVSTITQRPHVIARRTMCLSGGIFNAKERREPRCLSNSSRLDDCVRYLRAAEPERAWTCGSSHPFRDQVQQPTLQSGRSIAVACLSFAFSVSRVHLVVMHMVLELARGAGQQ